MKKTQLITSLALLSLLTGCTGEKAPAQAEMKTYSNTTIDSGFDTVITLSETTDNKDAFDEHFQMVCDSFSHYNDLFDIYNDYDNLNNLKTINDNAGIQAVVVEDALIDMLKEAKDFYTLSNGEFDITIGSLLHVWHTYREDGITMNLDGELAPIPAQSELEEAASFKGWDKVEINEEEKTVYINDPDVSLDVGGIAKGYACEKTAQLLEENGVEHAFINAGGNNRTIGAKIDGSDWRIGIQNPDGEGSILVVSMPGSHSFVTSGDYERYYVGTDNKHYSHIIDPATLYPADHFRSVSIITDDSGAADCLSTTLFTMSYEDGLNLVNSYRKLHPEHSLEVIWVSDAENPIDSEYGSLIAGYSVAWTDGLEGKLKWN